MRTTRPISISILLGALALAAPSAAQQPSPPAKLVAQAMTEKARQLFTEGVKAYQQSRWAEAHAAFLAAWALSKHYSIAGNLADCELKLGLHREAAEHFARYVREMAKDPGSTPQERKDGDARFALAKAKVGQVDVQVSVPGAEVYADGMLVGAAPLEDPLFLDPGPHALEARSDGYTPARVTLTATAGAAQPVALTLMRPLPATNAAPDATGPVKAGGWRPGLPVLVTGGALAVVGLAVGAGLAVAANGKGSAADAAVAMLPPSGAHASCATNMSACATINDDRQAHDALAKGALGTFIAGGAIGVATLLYGLLAPKGSAAPETKAVPVVGRDGAGVAVVGVW
jgi:PEGA domain